MQSREDLRKHLQLLLQFFLPRWHGSLTSKAVSFSQYGLVYVVYSSIILISNETSCRKFLCDAGMGNFQAFSGSFYFLFCISSCVGLFQRRKSVDECFADRWIQGLEETTQFTSSFKLRLAFESRLVQKRNLMAVFSKLTKLQVMKFS